MTVLIFWNCLEIPFRLAFQPVVPLAYLIVQAVVDWMFIADLVIRFFLPYLHRTGYFVTFPRSRIAKHFLRTWFVPDTVSSIPWDFIQLIIVAVDPVLGASLTWFNYARLTRMIRLLSISARLREWELTLNWNVGAIWFRALRIVLGIVIWLNSCACILWLIAVSENSSYSWITDDSIYNNVRGELGLRGVRGTALTVRRRSLTPTCGRSTWPRCTSP